MTPIQLEVAIRFHWDPEAKLHFDRHGNCSHEAAIQWLRNRGLLKTNADGTVISNQEPLCLFIQALTDVPLPVQGWRMP